MLMKNQKVIIFQDVTFGETSTRTKRYLYGSPRNVEFDPENEGNHLTSGEETEWHSSENFDLPQPDDTTCDVQNVESPADVETPNDREASLNNEGTGISDTNLENVTNYPNLRRSTRETAEKPLVRYGNDGDKYCLPHYPSHSF